MDRRPVELFACFAEVPDCDPSSFATRDYLVNLQAAMEAFAVDGTYAVDGIEPSTFRTDEVVMHSATAATVHQCVWDTAITFRRGADPSRPIVVNDLRITEISEFQVVKNGGKWYVARVDITSRTTGENLCVD